MDKVKKAVSRIKNNVRTELPKDVEWKEFKLSDIFEIHLAKPYHKLNLNILNFNEEEAISYISRTTFNNGLDCFIKKEKNMLLENHNSITIGAEGAVFFYQNRSFICGNKVSVLKNKKLNINIGLFIITILNNFVKNKYNYTNALTFGRLLTLSIYLPSKNNQPNWEYMNEFIVNLKNRINLF